MNPTETDDLHLVVRPIGVIRTPFRTASGTPIQPAYGLQATGEVEIREEYEAALSDIEGFGEGVAHLLDGPRGPVQASRGALP